MDLLIQLLLDNLDKVVYSLLLLLVAWVMKGKQTIAIAEAIQGVSQSVQKLVLEILAEIAKDHVSANKKLNTPIKLKDSIPLNDLRKEIAIQALKEKKNPDINKIAEKLGGYANLVNIVYKSARWFLKAIKK